MHSALNATDRCALCVLQVEPLARSVDSTSGVTFVPAFSGLFAPYWRSDARGCIVGMTLYTTKAHLCRATLEAVALQAREVLDATEADSARRAAEQTTRTRARVRAMAAPVSTRRRGRRGAAEVCRTSLSYLARVPRRSSRRVVGGIRRVLRVSSCDGSVGKALAWLPKRLKSR